jgi:DeoR family transcriptional regulator, galactitol utilization operon repressor
VFSNFSEREKLILDYFAEDDSLTVTRLSGMLGVSSVTVRNDLNSLAEKGYISRTHGGALPAFDQDILERQRERQEEKRRIAKAAAAMVQDGDSIMIEAGTTLALLAKYLLGKAGIHVVTNSTLVLPYARYNSAARFTMTGGEFRPSTESYVGPVAVREIGNFNVKLAFVGTDGFSLERGLTTHFLEGAEIVKAMAKQAEKTIVLADSSKYRKAGFVNVLPLSDIDTLVTDSGLSPETVTQLTDAGIRIVTA